MARIHNTLYKFGPFTLEPDERRISSEGTSSIDLTAKAFDLLLLLASKAGQLVTKDEILDAVWPEVSIAEGNLTTTISMIRKALQDDSEHRYIETVPKKGYRFVAQVSVITSQVRGKSEAVDQTSVPPAANGRRSRLLISGVLIILTAAGIGFVILHHGHPKSSFQDAVRHEAEGNDELAIKELENVPVSDSNFAEARLKAAWLLYLDDNNPDAKRDLSSVSYDKAISSLDSHGKATQWEIKGLNELLDEHTDRAFIDFQSAADAVPTDVDALIYIADTAIGTGNLEEAREALDKCRVRDDMNPFCGYERIDELAHEGKYVNAIAEYSRLRKKSDFPWLDQPAGYAELAKGNTLEARMRFNALVTRGMGLQEHRMAVHDGIAAADLLDGKITLAQSELKTATDKSDSGYEKADYLILSAKIEAFHGDSIQAKIYLDKASKLSDSPAFAIEIARTFAMTGDHANALRFLTQIQNTAPQLGKEYDAAIPFIDGLEWTKKNEFNKAVDQLNSSFDKDHNPETAYFLAFAEMNLKEWDPAIVHLNIIMNSKVKVFIDSVASLIPLSEYNLGVCYRAKGQESAAQNHFSAAREMWKNADPELKAYFTNPVSSAATKIRNSR
jgi:DNA-binding winged helix-turn-helix (wHTH) protein/tetratricopeptide (TPR) repeat protein